MPGLSPILGPARTYPEGQCVYCGGTCDRCGYPYSPGFEHVEQVQAPDGNHFVCSYRRHTAPLITVLDEYLTHCRDHVALRPVKDTPPL